MEVVEARPYGVVVKEVADAIIGVCVVGMPAPNGSPRFIRATGEMPLMESIEIEGDNVSVKEPWLRSWYIRTALATAIRGRQHPTFSTGPNRYLPMSHERQR